MGRCTAYVLLLGLLATACSEPHPVVIRDAWVRNILPSQAVTAGYLTLTNSGDQQDRLVAVSTAAFDSGELHEMKVDARGVMKMRKSGPIDLPVNEPVTLERGGLHLMLIGARYPIAAGNDIPLTLHFERSGDLTVAARVKDQP
ncbi:MAG: hypothetical protein CME19_13880 [Gemmatimonadetes bacterium]|nr:hypothetical protein [Gemmatimonadota bacterium]